MLVCEYHQLWEAVKQNQTNDPTPKKSSAVVASNKLLPELSGSNFGFCGRARWGLPYAGTAAKNT